MSDRPLTAAMLADALDCFWNAALDAARERQTSAAIDVANVMTGGLASVANRLREHAQEHAPDTGPDPIAAYTDGSAVYLDSYAGGAHAAGQWGELSLRFTKPGEPDAVRRYRADDAQTATPSQREAAKALDLARAVLKAEPLNGVVGQHGDEDVWAEVPEAGSLAAWVLDYLPALAAAPMAEPVSDRYKLDLSDVRSKLSEIVDCSRALRQGGPAPEDLEGLSKALDRATGLADDILANVVWADPSISPQPLSNPQQLPEAPKLDDDPVCTCCDGTGVTIQTERRCSCVTTHPAPASDELLKALRGLIDRSEEVRDMLASHPAMQGREHMSMGISFSAAIGRAQRAYVAKHKGPQS